MTAKEVLWYVTKHWSSPFRVRQFSAACPNVSWGFDLNYEADLLLVSRNGYMTEIEIKVSLSDWKQDFVKKKHDIITKRRDTRLKRFFYAGPEKLMSRFADISGLPPYAGIIAIKPESEDSSGVVTVLRPSVDLKPHSQLEAHHVNTLNRLAALRYWDNFEIEKDDSK